MTFVRTYAPVLSLVLGLGTLACNQGKPAGTTQPPGEGGNAAAQGGTDSPGTAGDGDGDSPSEDPPATAAKCDAKTAEVPSALFGDSVLVRPPVNVQLVEENPTFATTYASGGFVSACDATVDRMSLFVFESDKNKPLAKYMEEIIDDMLPKSGFAGGKRGKNHVETAGALHTDVEYPSENGNPPAQLYIAATRKLDYVLVAIYQTRPAEFPVLLPTFTASANTIFVVPPDA